MNRRSFLSAIASTALIVFASRTGFASTEIGAEPAVVRKSKLFRVTAVEKSDLHVTFSSQSADADETVTTQWAGASGFEVGDIVTLDFGH